MKHLQSLFALALLLSACAPAAPAATQTPLPPTAIPSPTVTPSPTIPNSLLTYEEILWRQGLNIEVVDNQVLLANHAGQVALTSLDGISINIVTEDGEALNFPEETFVLEPTIARGLGNVLTIQNAEGNVEYFYLKKTGLWATPIEQFTDPRDIENYPIIKLEDVWSGRTVISTALEAEPFPAGTLVPDEFAYMLWQGGAGSVRIQDFLNGQLDTLLKYHDDLRHHNDYRRYVAYYQSETPEGVAVILGTEQVLTPDGKTSIFFHYVFGDDWSWEEGVSLGSTGSSWNVVDSIFRGRDPSLDWNVYYPAVLRPIFTQLPRPDGSIPMQGWGNTGGAEESAGLGLYLNEPRNNPLSLRPDLQALIDERRANRLGQIDYLAPVGREMAEFSFKIWFGATGVIVMDTYHNP